MNPRVKNRTLKWRILEKGAIDLKHMVVVESYTHHRSYWSSQPGLQYKLQRQPTSQRVKLDHHEEGVEMLQDVENQPHKSFPSSSDYLQIRQTNSDKNDTTQKAKQFRLTRPKTESYVSGRTYKDLGIQTKWHYSKDKAIQTKTESYVYEFQRFVDSRPRDWLVCLLAIVV